MKTKLLIADDHTMFINGLKMLLSVSDLYEVVGVAHNGEEVLEVLKKQEVDVILMDINMPVLNGYQTTFRLKEEFPLIKIIILSMLADEQSVTKLLDAGADGYLFKNADEDELFEALEAVALGLVYITKEVRDKVQNRKKGIFSLKEVKLSSREIDIARLILNGCTNTEISEKLFISIRTAETHRKNILAKLNLKNTASLVKYLIDNKPFLEL
jgi:DNA-binding NarL/FixJ family response regulator